MTDLDYDTAHCKYYFSEHLFLCLEKERERERGETMPSFKAEKLRVNLRLSINRLKLLEKKKSE